MKLRIWEVKLLVLQGKGYDHEKKWPREDSEKIIYVELWKSLRIVERAGLAQSHSESGTEIFKKHEE